MSITRRVAILHHRVAAASLVTAGAALLAAAPSAGAVKPLLAVQLGETTVLSVGTGSATEVPSVKVETPPVAGTGPVKIAAGSEGVTVSTPVATTTVPVTTPSLPKVETPKVETPKVEIPKTPSIPTAPRVPEAVGSGGGGSGSSGSGSSPTRDATASSPSGSTASGSAFAATAPATSRSRGTGSAGHGSGPERSRTGAGSAPSGGGRTATTAAVGPASTKASVVPPRAHRRSRDLLSSLGSALPLPLPVPDWSKPIILLLLLLAVALGVRWRLAARRARRLERRQGTLLRDIESMQAALVPDVPEIVEGLAVSLAYRPAEGPAAGGDFYDVFSLGPGRVAMILGDVAGHGHDALRQAALTRYTLRAFLKETGDPRATLKLAGHALSEPGAEQLATVAVALYDRSEGTLSYALAGHPPPVLSGVARAEPPSSCSSPPVGCELPTGRRARTVRLPLGARACFFSDGLIEARVPGVNEHGHPRLLGRSRLAEIVSALPADAGARELLATVREEAAATPDDMAACIVTPGTAAPAGDLDVEELEIDSHAVGHGHLARYLHESGVSEQRSQLVLREVRVQLRSHDTALIVADRSGREIEVGVRAGGERNTPSRLLTGAARLPA